MTRLRIMTLLIMATSFTLAMLNSVTPTYAWITPTPAGSYGGKIAFVSSRGNGDFEIYVMDADGKNPHNLTNNSAEDQGAACELNGKVILTDTHIGVGFATPVPDQRQVNACSDTTYDGLSKLFIDHYNPSCISQN